MNDTGCPIHSRRWPHLWNPTGAPCASCTSDTVFTDASGARYVKSSDYIPPHWVRLADTPAIDTTKEGS